MLIKDQGEAGKPIPLESYRPPWYLRSGHLQTLITGFYRPKAPLPVAIEHRIPIGNAGSMLIHENRPSVALSANTQDEVGSGSEEGVLLLHGLGSSHSGTYMTNIARDLLHAGFRVFRADLPGAGKSFHHTWLPAHGACYGEIWTCLTWLRDQLGIRRWRLGGVSLGGNLLLKLVAEKSNCIDLGDGTKDLSIIKTVAVAPPIDLGACCANMEQGLNRIYNKYFIRALKKQSLERAELWPEWKEVIKTASFASIRQFDETVTAPLAGFENATAYYAAGSSINQLPNIRVPTTILIDEHDPIVPSRLFDGVPLSNSTKLFRTRFGGHVGYLGYDSGPNVVTRGSMSRWADTWIADELVRLPS